MVIDLTDETGKQIKAVQTALFDAELNSGERDFELVVDAESDPEVDIGCRIFVPGTEIGGVIGELTSKTASTNLEWRGYTWRGLLNKKILFPNSGQDYLSVNGELNAILRQFMNRKIINVVSSRRVPAWGNKKRYIAVHYLGVVGQNHELTPDGCGAHFYIYWDGTIYQRCSLDAVPWAVGTAGYYTQKHPSANNYNTISIEMCCKCDGNSASAEDMKWYFTVETQEACAWLIQKLMKENGIPLENVLRHYDIVNKICPAPYVHNNRYRGTWTWDEFKAHVSGSKIEITVASSLLDTLEGYQRLLQTEIKRNGHTVIVDAVER